MAIAQKLMALPQRHTISLESAILCVSWSPSWNTSTSEKSVIICRFKKLPCSYID